jgi:hypothetical protein
VSLADRPCSPCSSCVLRVLARLHFQSVLFSSFGWTRFRTVRSRGADNPRAGGQSATTPRTVRFSRGRYWMFCWLFRTVRGSGQTVRRTRADSPRGSCGPSAPPGRTVRQCLTALFLGSIPPSFLSCFRVCFKESFRRLEVDP